MAIDAHVTPILWSEVLEPGELERWGDIYSAHLMGAMDWDEVAVEMDAGNVNTSFVTPLDLTSTQGLEIVGNDRVFNLVQAHPERLVGFASVDPGRPDAAAELERCFFELGLKGLYLHPSKQRFDITGPEAGILLSRCEELNKPVIIHAGMSWQPDTVDALCRPSSYEPIFWRYPALKVSLTNFGWPWVSEVVALMLKHPNCVADTAVNTIGSPQEMMERLFCHELGPRWLELALGSQIMFASNTPRFRAFKMLRALDAIEMPAHVRARIYEGTARWFIEGDPR